MLMKKAINILGVPVTPFSMEEAVSFLMDRIAKKMPTQVVTANAEIIMMARNDKRYGTLLQQADLVLADGAGTVWAGRTLGYEVPERVAGFDLFVELIKKSAEEGIKLYFFGATPGIAEAAKAKARQYSQRMSGAAQIRGAVTGAKRKGGGIPFRRRTGLFHPAYRRAHDSHVRKAE